MNDRLYQFVHDELSNDLNCKREEMRFAEKFARSLAQALEEISMEFNKQEHEFQACPITKIANLKVHVEEINLEIWSFCITVKIGISIAEVWVNKGPGIVLFELSRQYTERTTTFRRAAVQFEQTDQLPNPTDGPFPPKVAKQNWTPSSLWLTNTVKTDTWVAPEMLAVQIIKHLIRYDIAADLEAIVE